MPRGDHTGPEGAGPMTGRGMGYCAGNSVPGYAVGPGRGRFRAFASNPAFGRGAGFGHGAGFARGWGFGRGWGATAGYVPGAGFARGSVPPVDPRTRAEFLDQEIGFAEQRIEALRRERDSLDADSAEEESE